MRRYPYTIENGAGEWLTFSRRIPTATGDRLEVDNVVAPGGGPPMHVHHLQAESITVVEGRLAYARPGSPPGFAGPGESVAMWSFAPSEAAYSRTNVAYASDPARTA